MYKNQLQELAQRSCFNLPTYTCLREGPDHAPRFKATVTFNGETFESPHYCPNLRQAEHSAAGAALASLSSRGPSQLLAARVLDETGVYKNLLQEISQRVGSHLPHYTTFRSGLGHLPVFTGTVELAGITFRGEPAKNKKQAEKNAALAAWLALKKLAQLEEASSSEEHENNNDDKERIKIARALQNYSLQLKKPENPKNLEKSLPLPFHTQSNIILPHSTSASKILPLFSRKTHEKLSRQILLPDFQVPYVPMDRRRQKTYRGMAPPVMVRSAVPVFSAPLFQPPAMRLAPPPVHARLAVPLFACGPGPFGVPATLEEIVASGSDVMCDVDESTALKCLEQLEI
ncbi:Double-stranded RNA-binding protein 2 [Striga hermonthica]|uniref:Double-stranded RNA-binding protein 2 n=1 Tax=Striga hermonthica TaxID=68872 RepID=A0A9N7MQD5_STRHE|nr:Double-stranded RNA-binding protein 2 [Striga hermonthica]